MGPPSHPLLDRDYAMGHKLGRGCFATVYKATRRSDDLPVAIKVIAKDRLDEETARLLDNELQILRAVSQHPGIVTLLDNLDTETHMFFVMNYVEGGPLLDRIVSRGTFSENDARILFRTILLTLQFLSQLGCVHRDIKPENILVDNHSRVWPVKLTDFGLSAKMQPDKLLYGALGTPLFVAPEILKELGYDSACDMWSLGVMMYIVLCGYPPFPFNVSPAELIGVIVNGRYEFPAGEWDHVSSDAKDVVRRMLEVDPAKRITPGEALQHPWVLRSQSRSELPNRNLKSFNARRKLKATVVAVRTTCEFMNVINGSCGQNSGPRCEVGQEELLRDVERSRALIKKMGLDNSKPKAIHDKNGVAFSGEAVMSRGSRRSLVLPMSIIGDGGEGEGETAEYWKVGGGQSRPLLELDALASQNMESRAKAMVAEVYEGNMLNLKDSANPFMAGSESDDSNEAGGGSESGSDSGGTGTGTDAEAKDEVEDGEDTQRDERPSGQVFRRPVAQLDLGILGL